MILQIRFLFLIAWAMLSLSCASSTKNIQAVSALNAAQVSQASPKPKIKVVKKIEPDLHLIIASDLSLQESAGFPTQINVIVNSYDCRRVTEVLREQQRASLKSNYAATKPAKKPTANAKNTSSRYR